MPTLIGPLVLADGLPNAAHAVPPKRLRQTRNGMARCLNVRILAHDCRSRSHGSRGATTPEIAVLLLMNAGRHPPPLQPRSRRCRNSTHTWLTSGCEARYVARNGPYAPRSMMGI